MLLDNLYHCSAEAVRQAISKEKSVRSAVYGSQFENKKQLMRICCETLKNRDYFDSLLASAPLNRLLKEPQYEHFSMLYVLLYEFLFGNKLRRCSKKLSAPIFACKDVLLKRAEELRNIPSTSLSKPICSVEAYFPKYARINTLKWTQEEAVKALSEEGWILENLPLLNDTAWYKDRIKSMKSDEVFCDPHVNHLLIFPTNTDLHDHWAVTDGYLILQDKASCLSSFLLNPKRESHVIDVCAAPGMKTSHLAAILGNKGKIWAMDKAMDRVKTLHSMLEKAGAANVSVFCGDCLQLNVNDKKFSKVQYALVDPPCSGSGIVKRMDSFVNDSGDVTEVRLRSLSNLQAMILKHILKLPALKKVVYSTCSVFEEENEQVVQEVLEDEDLSKMYKLANASPAWSLRGLEKYPFGKRCIRATPEDSLTNGFFVAVFKKRKTKIENR